MHFLSSCVDVCVESLFLISHTHTYIQPHIHTNTHTYNHTYKLYQNKIKELQMDRGFIHSHMKKN